VVSWGLLSIPVVRGYIRRRSATHSNFDAVIRGLKPHGYLQETAPRSFKMSKLQRGWKARLESLPYGDDSARRAGQIQAFLKKSLMTAATLWTWASVNSG
jgi:hypothetical protein